MSDRRPGDGLRQVSKARGDRRGGKNKEEKKVIKRESKKNKEKTYAENKIKKSDTGRNSEI